MGDTEAGPKSRGRGECEGRGLGSPPGFMKGKEVLWRRRIEGNPSIEGAVVPGLGGMGFLNPRRRLPKGCKFKGKGGKELGTRQLEFQTTLQMNT